LKKSDMKRVKPCAIVRKRLNKTHDRCHAPGVLKESNQGSHEAHHSTGAKVS
jgi:hypothetical protein